MSKRLNINWYAVGAAAFTAIRFEMSVVVLQELSEFGNDTPASGDALAQALFDVKGTKKGTQHGQQGV